MLYRNDQPEFNYSYNLYNFQIDPIRLPKKIDELYQLRTETVATMPAFDHEWAPNQVRKL